MTLVACAVDPGPSDGDGYDEPPAASGELEGLPSGSEQWRALCAKGYSDLVTKGFCIGTRPPYLRGLTSIYGLIGLDKTRNSRVVMTLALHSTGVGVRTVTSLNPRAIVMSETGLLGPSETFVVLAFARGEPLVEIIARDPVEKTLRFFLLRFHLACESTTAGCSHADLLTPTIESGWTGYSLYDDATLANTTMDCLSCHQTGGPGAPRFLRMQELLGPWTHFIDFGQNANFQRTHGGESYAGVPVGPIPGPPDTPFFDQPSVLQDLVIGNGFRDQPNEFESSTIKSELSAMGISPTWQVLYENAVSGRMIPPPYFGEDQTDPPKVARMVDAYQAVMRGTLARELLPDLRDTLLEDALPAMSIRPKPGLDGRGILVHMCSRCHNGRLDQSLSRARFNVEILDMMPRAEKNLAIERLMLGVEDRRMMPPPRFHVLSSEERALAIEALRQ